MQPESIYIDGKKVEIHSPVEAMKMGIATGARGQEERGPVYKVQKREVQCDHRGLARFIKGIFVNGREEEQITQHYIDMMSTKTPTQDTKIGNLSGGNQQKVMIGRWLATAPKILIMD